MFLFVCRQRLLGLLGVQSQLCQGTILAPAYNPQPDPVAAAAAQKQDATRIHGRSSSGEVGRSGCGKRRRMLHARISVRLTQKRVFNIQFLGRFE